ncbi:class I SAM-dependent methyltransferase [Halobaculum sp. EA56]|uniref:class I SAM-dependent methyltransferase n=1 Tax=Halobaculum sp. EA56 TaxID=3421648 RepID=UPI003EB6BB98
MFWEDIVTVVPPLVDESTSEVVEVWEEIADDRSFTSEIETHLSRTSERPSILHSNWRELLYVLVRIHEPTQVVETGVYDGLSSAYILKGLERNGRGQLISIDINDTTRLPSDIGDADAGWIVPDSLHQRWERRYGDAIKLLPEAVTDAPPEIFLHDSLHTREHMRFELTTAVDAMQDGGIVVADNSRFNNEFRSITEEQFDEVSFWKNTKYAYKDGDKLTTG